MNTHKKGKKGEDQIISELERYGLDVSKTVRSGSAFGDGDIILKLGDLPHLVIDSKNEAKINKTLLNKLRKVENQAGRDFNFGCIVDFDESGDTYMHIKLSSIANIISYLIDNNS